MSTVTTYPSHSTHPAYVDADRLRSVLQRQQHDQAVSAPVPVLNYLIDVPVSDGDVKRWDAVFTETHARTRAAQHARAHCVGEGETATTISEGAADIIFSDGGSREQDEEGTSSYFLNADAMLNYLPSDAARRARTYATLAPMAPFNPTAVVTLPMTRALKVRREWLPHRNQFPLYQQRTRLMDAVLNREFVAVVGQTGSGRTLQTPIILSETEAFRRRRIIVVSATATAARLTAVRLRIERGEDAVTSRSVAAVLPLHNEVTPGTVIVTTTGEVLLRQLLADPLLLDVGCVIFDDAHLRSAESEVCLALLRERMVLYRLFEDDRQRRGGGGGRTDATATTATGTSTSSSASSVAPVRRLTVVANCPDEASAAPLLEYFKSPVPTTTTSLFVSNHGGDSAAATLPPCSTERLVLESPGGNGGGGDATNVASAAGLAASVVNGSGASTAPLVRGGSNPVFYVEELVQWLHKCRTEGCSKLCRDPEAELQPFVESVDVVTRIMEAGEADFSNVDKCKSYWCAIIAEAVHHFTDAVRSASNASVGAGAGTAPTTLIVAPNITTARLILATLRSSLEQLAASGADSGGAGVGGAGNEEAGGSHASSVSASYRFTLLDENRTPFEEFLAFVTSSSMTAGKINTPPSLTSAAANTSAVMHVVLTTPELAQTVLPPTLSIDLVIDCARTSHRSFDVNAACDVVVTEYASTQALRHRRSIAASSKGVTGVEDGGEKGGERASSSLSVPPLSARFMTVQLIPKGVLHSVQHRRMSADPLQQHPIFRLSFERYLRLYQVFQARDEAAAYARQLSVLSGAASSYLSPSTVSSRAAHWITSTFVGVPAASSGARYEHMRRVLTLVENYLIAAGHIDLNTTVSGEPYATMKPLGVLATLLAGPMPTSVTRLLVLSALFACPVVATAVAAIWLVGDAFNSSLAASLAEAAVEGPTRTKDELAEEEDELRALTKEARLFFSRDSLSDVVSGFNVYRMWLSMRTATATSSCTSGIASESEMNEDERAFLHECRVPRRLLQRIEHTQRDLYALLVRSGLAVTMPADDGRGKERDHTLVAQLLALPEDAVLDSKVQACLTGALYPNCAAIEDSRDAKLSAMVLLDSLHVVSAGRANANVATVTAKRLGVFGENSVVSDPDTAARITGRPFLFLDKVVGTSSAGTNAAHIYILEQAAPLQLAAAVVFCGEGHLKQKEAPSRCRGWTPCSTGAWRHTRRSRMLPPPAQLPTPSIQLSAYDTVKADAMIVSTDDNFRLTMRSTTSQWLLRVRRHIQAQLQCFLWGNNHHQSTVGEATAVAATASTMGPAEMFGDVADAWNWWSRRQREASSWLRESRRALANQRRDRLKTESSHPGEAHQQDGDHDEDEGKRGAEEQRNLYGFYVFSTAIGAPERVVLPVAGAAAAASHSKTAASAATTATSANTGGATAVNADGTTTSSEANATDSTSFSGAPAKKVYTGKRPRDDIDEVIRLCVKGVAQSRTREHEAVLLRDDPVNFSFLNPDNEFHEYYLYRLQEAAPNLEVLGDSIEELVTYLEHLEVELRKELGYPDPHISTAAGAASEATAASAGRALTAPGGDGSAGRAPQLREVVDEATGAEDDDAMATGFATGLQVETDASVLVKRQAGLNFAPRKAVESTNTAATGAPSSVASPTVITTAALSPPSQNFEPAARVGDDQAPAMSGQQTLLQKLMAMKNASGGGSAAPQQPPQHQQQPSPPPETRSAGTGMFMPPGAGTAPTTFASTLTGGAQPPLLVPPKSTADLLAILTRTAPSTKNRDGGASDQMNPTMRPTPPAASTASTAAMAYSLSSPVPSPSASDAGANAPRAPAPTTAELLALLGMAPRAQTGGTGTASAVVSNPVNSLESNGEGADTMSILGLAPPPPPRYLQPPGMMANNAQHMPGYSVNPYAVMGTVQQQQYQQYQEQHPPLKQRRLNPLTRPPPPLPAKVVEDSPPSVLVYPIPESREGLNLRLALARALGAELDMMVGPTLIVGRVARIMVPNSKVAARAMALGKFRCQGVKVYVFKNDRLIDNPDRPPQEDDSRRLRGRGGRGGGGRVIGAGVGGGAPRLSSSTGLLGETAATTAGAGCAGSATTNAASSTIAAADEEEGMEDDDPTAMGFQNPQESVPVGISIAAFSDSDDDGDKDA